MNTDREASLEILNLGLREYPEVWELQRQRQKALINKEQRECLIFCVHPPTITLGTSSKDAHILISPEEMARQGIGIFKVERGGDVTYHGPGQLVCYPIIDLSTRKRDVLWYMRLLEEAIIRTLEDFKVRGARIQGKTGVWIRATPERKIASIGVRLSRWCSMHGLALNVLSAAEGRDLIADFRSIQPCGFSDIEITTIERETSQKSSVQEVEKRLENHLVTLLTEWQAFKTSPS